MYNGLIDTFRSRLPVDDTTPIVTLLEGRTPLIECKRLLEHCRVPVTLFVKYEGLNPTASFKDRGMTLAISKAVEAGSRAVICASTGNTSASAAAYAARAGLKTFVIIPEGQIAMGKLAQAMIHNARVLQIQGNFDKGLEIVKHIADKLGLTVVNSINPYRLEGQKTASFEIVDQLGYAPTYHALPVGNAGNITAHWMGYTEYFQDQLTDTRPKMLGYQAANAAPFLVGKPIDNPETLATAIRIGHPQSWDKAIEAQTQSGGWFAKVTDGEILMAQKKLASCEGIFCEPASAACIAGVLNDIEAGNILEGSTIVCTLTGHGLKDPDTAIDQSRGQLVSVQASFEAVGSAIEAEL